MKKENARKKNIPFDGLLADATPEIRTIFEAFYSECIKLADKIEAEFSNTVPIDVSTSSINHDIISDDLHDDAGGSN
jgi:hypothetical protein